MKLTKKEKLKNKLRKAKVGDWYLVDKALKIGCEVQIISNGKLIKFEDGRNRIDTVIKKSPPPLHSYELRIPNDWDENNKSRVAFAFKEELKIFGRPPSIDIAIFFLEKKLEEQKEETVSFIFFEFGKFIAEIGYRERMTLFDLIDLVNEDQFERMEYFCKYYFKATTSSDRANTAHSAPSDQTPPPTKQG